jgi:ArsR family transcriptional regulator
MKPAPRPIIRHAEECARKMHVLGDPMRWRVIETLLEGAKHVNEIQAVVGLEQSHLSYHLRKLREEGLVRSEIDGKSRLYSVVRTADGKGLDLGCCTLDLKELRREAAWSRPARPS